MIQNAKAQHSMGGCDKNNFSKLCESQPEKCEFCDITFLNRYRCLIHTAKHIIIPLLKLDIVRCEYCLFCFTSITDLISHKKIKHTDEYLRELMQQVVTTNVEIKCEKINLNFNNDNADDIKTQSTKNLNANGLEDAQFIKSRIKTNEKTIKREINDCEIKKNINLTLEHLKANASLKVRTLTKCNPPDEIKSRLVLKPTHLLKPQPAVSVNINQKTPLLKPNKSPMINQMLPLVNSKQPSMINKETPLMNPHQSPMVNPEQSSVINQMKPLINPNQSPMINRMTPVTYPNQSPMFNLNQLSIINSNQLPIINPNQLPMINPNQSPMFYSNQSPMINPNQAPIFNLNKSPMIDNGRMSDEEFILPDVTPMKHKKESNTTKVNSFQSSVTAHEKCVNSIQSPAHVKYEKQRDTVTPIKVKSLQSLWEPIAELSRPSLVTNQSDQSPKTTNHRDLTPMKKYLIIDTGVNNESELVPTHEAVPTFVSIHYDDLVRPGIFPCKKCGLAFPNKFDVVTHETTHLKMKKKRPGAIHCSICDYYIAGNHHSLNNHMASQHPDMKASYHFKHCPKCKLRYTKLSRHERIYHDKTVPSVPKKKIDNYLCDVCSMFMKNNSKCKYKTDGVLQEYGKKYSCTNCNAIVDAVEKFCIYRTTGVREKSEKRGTGVSNEDRLKKIHRRLHRLKKIQMC